MRTPNPQWIPASELLEALKTVREPEDAERGICEQVAHFLDYHLFYVCYRLRELTKKWSGYSGNEHYPVPCPKEHLMETNPHQWAFERLPKWLGEYGQSRIDLLNFLIKEIENELLEQANGNHTS